MAADISRMELNIPAIRPQVTNTDRIANAERQIELINREIQELESLQLLDQKMIANNNKIIAAAEELLARRRARSASPTLETMSKDAVKVSSNIQEASAKVTEAKEVVKSSGKELTRSERINVASTALKDTIAKNSSLNEAVDDLKNRRHLGIPKTRGYSHLKSLDKKLEWGGIDYITKPRMHSIGEVSSTLESDNAKVVAQSTKAGRIAARVERSTQVSSNALEQVAKNKQKQDASAQTTITYSSLVPKVRTDKVEGLNIKPYSADSTENAHARFHSLAQEIYQSQKNLYDSIVNSKLMKLL